jgi:predicted PurR-regulated permease PerM
MKDIPISVKRSIELMGIFILGIIIYIGKVIIMPVLLAFFLSLMLMPLFRLFRKVKIPETIAIFLSILCLTIFAGLVGWLFYGQMASLLVDLPEIEKNVTKHLDKVSIWIDDAFGFSPGDQFNFINRNSTKFFGIAESGLRGTIASISNMLIFFGLLPVYIYLTILYRNLFLKFILMWTSPNERKNVMQIIPRLEGMVKNYALGLLIQFTYIIILLGVTLTLVGIKHGLLIGIMFAFLNLIPYLGPFIGNILAILITLASSDRIADIIIVFGIIAIVQFLDNNILMPGIVGSQVKINALVSIVGIFIGGALAGISGMFLAMPIIAVLKIFFDNSRSFRQWGILLGDTRPKKADLILQSEEN